MLLSWDTANELVVSRKAEPNGVGCAAATSRKAREVAHPQLFRLMLKDKPALYFPFQVAHPPFTSEVFRLTQIEAAQVEGVSFRRR
jgi:hypothetical protein